MVEKTGSGVNVAHATEWIGKLLREVDSHLVGFRVEEYSVEKKQDNGKRQFKEF